VGRWSGNRGFRKLVNSPILSPAADKRHECGAGFAGQTRQRPSSMYSANASWGKPDRQYFKSFFSLHISQKVCKVHNVMTCGPALAGRSQTADTEVSGAVAGRLGLSSSKSQWYFHAVAIVRVGKPLRTPARAVATSCPPFEVPTRFVERDGRNPTDSVVSARTNFALSVPMSDDLAIPR
jgi:hypothetical protein